MSIVIPSNLTLNRRSYGVGIEIELDEGNLPVTKDHPLVVLALKYIASPVSTEDYNKIEENFGNYLDSGLLEQIAEDDVDFTFDKEEYNRHLTAVKKYLKDLTLKTLLQHLTDYVGKSNKKYLSANIRDTSEEGKEVKVSDFSEYDSRERVLNFNIKGKTVSKINEAIRRNIPYKPVMQIFADAGHMVDDYSSSESSSLPEGTIIFDNGLDPKRPISDSISLAGRKTKVKMHGREMTLTINMGKAFEVLFKEQAMTPIKRRGSRIQKQSKSFFFFDENSKLKDESYLKRINLLYEFNKILQNKDFDVDEDGLKYTEESRARAIDEGDFEKEIKMLEEIRKLDLITQKQYDDFINGKRFTSFKMPNNLVNIIELEIEHKTNVNKDKDPQEYLSEVELFYQGKKAKKKQSETIKEAEIENTSIISAPPGTTYSDRNLFIDESWKKNPNEIKLNFGALKYNRKLKKEFDKILIPSYSQIKIDLVVLTNLDKNIEVTKEGEQEFINLYKNVVRVKGFNITEQKLDAETMREINPEYRRNTRTDDKGEGFGKLRTTQGAPDINRKEGEKLSNEETLRRKKQAIIDAGLPSGGYSRELNAFMNYIMRQTNKLERDLGGEII
tara:strand:+ start:246 stop:2090 length:1845 start_codon:yes stop_codon:yes gene_type:complete